MFANWNISKKKKKDKKEIKTDKVQNETRKHLNSN